MTNNFKPLSRQIADKFIQNIVIIDDKAYFTDNTKNAFDASVVAKIFADAGKICAIYAPQSDTDIDKYEEIINKADIVILDWYLFIKNEEDTNLEEDADATDPRGEFTLKLIKNYLAKQKESLKLFVVYTGETDLEGITEEIAQKINDGSFSLCNENCSVYSSKVRIVVRAKSQDSESQFAQIPGLKNKIVPYEGLPNFILDEFTEMTSGLLSNFALASISAIRENTSRVLSVFSPELDTAYLGHKVLLEDTSESKHMLIKLFGEAIAELLEVTNINTDTWVQNWIETKIKDEEITVNGVKVSRTKEDLINLITSERENLDDRFKATLGKNISTKNIQKIKTHAAELFLYENVNIENANLAFAKLTHHKNSFKPMSGTPVLTLGTIVKNEDKYYVCIQQRCDSVRIKEESRPFLFLSLGALAEGRKDQTPIIIDDMKMSPNMASYAIQTFEFKPNPGESVIRAVNRDGKKIFRSLDMVEFEWIVDLKDLQAQRIVNNYCAKLSRVGLNESEWLRLSSK